MQILKCFIGDIANGEMEKFSMIVVSIVVFGIFIGYMVGMFFNPGSDNKQIQERTVDAKGEEIDNLPTLRVS